MTTCKSTLAYRQRMEELLATYDPSKYLEVEIRNVYGNPVIYPKCEMSRLFAEIAGQKTLTQANIATLKKYGYTIETTKESTTL